jgi:hypothetical protein
MFEKDLRIVCDGRRNSDGTESGMGLQRLMARHCFRKVVECGSPMPLLPLPQCAF